MYRCRNSVKKVCDGKKIFNIDSSESEYTSASNGEVTFIKEWNTPTRIYFEEDGSGESDDCKTQCIMKWQCQKLVMLLFNFAVRKFWVVPHHMSEILIFININITQ